VSWPTNWASSPGHRCVTLGLARAEAHWLQDRPGAAQYEAGLAADACIGLDCWQRGAVATWLRRTRSPRLIHGKVARPYRLLLDGDPAEAAQVGPRTASRAHPLGLTRREREILDLICAEHTNAEISAKLSVSAKTVRHHVSAILANPGVPTRAAARLRKAGSGKTG
jgi:DNA-binding CsgD family transcriptional regulator